MQSINSTSAIPADEQWQTTAQEAENHRVAYRASSSLFGRRFYLAFFMGTERRSTERLEREGQVQPFTRLFLFLVGLAWLVFWLTVIALGLGVIAAYLVKSAAGINLFEGPSFLHPYFFD